jgi:hypothetical protein
MEEEKAAREERTGESEQERLNRNMNELLQELRVSQTGVQILFAFLLTLPFTQRFAQTTSFQRDVYFATVLLAGAASAFFIAPASAHRLLFRRQEKRYLVFQSNWMAIAGLACLAVAMLGVIVLIADFVFSAALAVIAGAFFFLLFGTLWFALPLLWLLRRGDD